MLFELTLPDLPFAAIMGATLGVFFILELDTVVINIMDFVKGWRK